MRCYRCKKEIADLKTAMIFWKETEGEAGSRPYEEFEIAHKTCKPRERWELSWELGWFQTDSQVLEWLGTIIPRSVMVRPGSTSRVPESLIHVIVDLSRELIKGEEVGGPAIER